MVVEITRMPIYTPNTTLTVHVIMHLKKKILKINMTIIAIIAILDISNNRCLKYEYRPTLNYTMQISIEGPDKLNSEDLDR